MACAATYRDPARATNVLPVRQKCIIVVHHVHPIIDLFVTNKKVHVRRGPPSKIETTTLQTSHNNFNKLKK